MITEATIKELKTFVNTNNLTALELLMLTSFYDSTNPDEWYLHPSDVVNLAGIPTNTGKGVLGSLVKKHIIEIEDMFSTGIPVAYILGSPKNQ